MRLSDLINAVRSALSRNSGCTLDPFTLESPKVGYAVSVPGAELRSNDVPPSNEVMAWLNGRAWDKVDALALKGLKAFVGAWQDGRHSYLDVSVVFADKAEAMAKGREWGQLAIFDLGAMEEIRLG